MSYKARVVGTAQEILLCSVKDLNGPRTKTVAMPYETYLTIRKEMEVEILSIIQAGRPESYRSRLEIFKGKREGTLPSQRPEWKKKQAASQRQNDKTYLPEDTDVIPDPPAQNKEKLPGEDANAYRNRRSREGRAFKEWERKYGEAHARARSAESVPPSEGARNGSESETEEAGFDSAGAPGNEAADQVPDPIKEAIERASHEELMKQNQ